MLGHCRIGEPHLQHWQAEVANEKTLLASNLKDRVQMRKGECAYIGVFTLVCKAVHDKQVLACNCICTDKITEMTVANLHVYSNCRVSGIHKGSDGTGSSDMHEL